MTETPFTEAERDAYIAAASSLLALPVDPTWEPAIGANLTVLRAAAELVAGFPLPEEVEAAPIFTA
jgi:hypothetical protein